jgi:hypothetical protein
MVHAARLESQSSTRAAAGALSVGLHSCLLLLILFAGGPRDGTREGEASLGVLVMLDARIAERRTDIEWPPTPDTLALPEPTEPRVTLERAEPVAPPLSEPDRHPEDVAQVPAMPLADEALAEILEHDEAAESLATLRMPESRAAELLQRLERLAEELAAQPRATASWEQDGTRYEVEFVHEPAPADTALERVVADVIADEQGRRMHTQLTLKRLPFSGFAKVVDRWDPMVQLHDDEIVGRMHINSRFNLLHDSQATPRLLGKVSTAASGFNLQSTGRRRGSEVFRRGVETGAGRIVLPEQAQAFAAAEQESGARVHRLAGDTRIRFHADGRYSWHEPASSSVLEDQVTPGQPVYFIGAPGATVFVQGVVAGTFLVYSPRRIVIEGNLAYARDPRVVADSGDCLGLVSDRDIEVASPRVTGPGDLEVDAALYAKRRFVVTDIDHSRTATLRIYGSLAAGSLTASEPRYATRIEYDPRFERQRPPGFPSTNRFAAEDWDGMWIEEPASLESLAQGTD